MKTTSKNRTLPEGPYTSPWAFAENFIIRTVRHLAPVYAIVQNGQQAADTSLVFESYRDAKTWLKENGYSLGKTVK